MVSKHYLKKMSSGIVKNVKKIPNSTPSQANRLKESFSQYPCDAEVPP